MSLRLGLTAKQQNVSHAGAFSPRPLCVGPRQQDRRYFGAELMKVRPRKAPLSERDPRAYSGGLIEAFGKAEAKGSRKD